jgi:hypothetical protein
MSPVSLQQPVFSRRTAPVRELLGVQVLTNSADERSAQCRQNVKEIPKTVPVELSSGPKWSLLSVT